MPFTRERHASSSESEKDMKHTGTAILDVPADQVDLENWIFTLSDAEYQACSRGHRAAGAFVQDGVRGTVNVEAIGGHLIVQHYHEVSAKPSHVEMLSKNSRVYLFHVVPATIQVRWTMSVAPRDAESSEFSCTVELIMPPVLRLLGAMSLLGLAIRVLDAQSRDRDALNIRRRLRRQRRQRLVVHARGDDVGRHAAAQGARPLGRRRGLAGLGVARAAVLQEDTVDLLDCRGVLFMKQGR